MRSKITKYHPDGWILSVQVFILSLHTFYHNFSVFKSYKKAQYYLQYRFETYFFTQQIFGKYTLILSP